MSLTDFIGQGRGQVVLLSLLTAALWSALLWLLIASTMGGDVRATTRLAADRYHPPLLTDVKRTSPDGYDGQFYLTLATDPLMRDERTVRGIDNPRYRGNRVMLPLAAWVLSLGRPAAASYVYLFLCWVLGVGAVILAGVLLRDSGRSPWWAALLIMNAGLVTSMTRGLPDGAALTLVLASLLAYRRERFNLALALTVIACLTRETSFLAALVLAYHHQIRTGRWTDAARFIVVPLLFLLVLKLWLLLTVHGDTTAVTTNFGVPLTWLPDKVARLGSASALQTAMEGLATSAHLMALVLSFYLARRVHRMRPLVGVFVLFGLMGCALQLKVWVEAYAYARVLIVTPFAALIQGVDELRPTRKALLLSIPLLDSMAGGLLFVMELGGAVGRLF